MSILFSTDTRVTLDIPADLGTQSQGVPMKLNYGFNEADNWWHFALGENRERIWAQYQELRTRVIRIFLFDKHAPHPIHDWPALESYIQAVLNSGAVPMVTFARFPHPYQEPRALPRFIETCGEVIWSCIERWGGEQVRDWFWCVWNEPNNKSVGGNISFDLYRRIYEAVAQEAMHWLATYLDDRKPLIGGPAVDGFNPNWLDWICRFVHEVDDRLIGFVSWHRYGDWRPTGKWDAPADTLLHRRLLLAQTPDYEARTRAVTQFLRGRNILNVCGELNAHSHHKVEVSSHFNQTMFGAVYYMSALLHLMRGGADIEMLWAGTDEKGPYGAIGKNALVTPIFYAKKLLVQHLEPGDRLNFSAWESGTTAGDLVVVHKPDGRICVLVINLCEERIRISLPSLKAFLKSESRLQRFDCSTGHVVSERYTGEIDIQGYGIAAVSSES
jgi:hypothetical protein